MIEWIQVILEFLAMIGIIFLIMFKKNYFPKYLEEKGKNLATKEDVADITKKGYPISVVDLRVKDCVVKSEMCD